MKYTSCGLLQIDYAYGAYMDENSLHFKKYSILISQLSDLMLYFI